MIFLEGGGDGCGPIDAAFGEAAVRAGAKSVLYVPHALAPERRPAAVEWFAGAYGKYFPERRTVEDLGDIVRSAEDFGAVYLGGGDTGALLDSLRAAGMDGYIERHLARGGLLYGGSAGAIVCGRTIMTAPEHEHSPLCNDGLDLLGGASVLPHYAGEAQHAARLARGLGTTVWALPEGFGLEVDRSGFPRAHGERGWAPFAAPGDGRGSGRVLLLDGEERLLLFRTPLQPGRPELGHRWFTPGGGIQDGESPREAAARELREETGLVLASAELGPLVAQTARYDRADWAEGLFSSDFYFYRTDSHEVDTSGFEELERSTIDGHRWWTIDELEAAGEVVRPLGLPPLLRDLLAGRVPAEPVQLPRFG